MLKEYPYAVYAPDVYHVYYLISFYRDALSLAKRKNGIILFFNGVI